MHRPPGSSGPEALCMLDGWIMSDLVTTPYEYSSKIFQRPKSCLLLNHQYFLGYERRYQSNPLIVLSYRPHGEEFAGLAVFAGPCAT